MTYPQAWLMQIKQPDDSIALRAQLAIELYGIKSSYKKAGENATVLAAVNSDGKPSKFYACFRGSEFVYILPPKAQLAIK